MNGKRCLLGFFLHALRLYSSSSVELGGTGKLALVTTGREAHLNAENSVANAERSERFPLSIPCDSKQTLALG